MKINILLIALLAITIPHMSCNLIESSILKSDSFTLLPGMSFEETIKDFDMEYSIMIVINYSTIATAQGSVEAIVKHGIHPVPERCYFSSSSNLCVIESPSNIIQLNFICYSNPCSAIYTISQRKVVTIEEKSVVELRVSNFKNIYKLSISQFHAMISIDSLYAEDHHLLQNIVVLSNLVITKYIKTSSNSNGMLLALEPIRSKAEQYIFFQINAIQTSVSLEIKFMGFAGMIMKNQPVLDFINSTDNLYINSYKYTLGSFVHNFMTRMKILTPLNKEIFGLIVKVTGIPKNTKNYTPETIYSLKVPQIIFESNHNFYDFAVTIPKSKIGLYSDIAINVQKLQIESLALPQIIQFQLEILDELEFDVNIFDEIFTALASGQDLKFKLISEVQASINSLNRLMPLKSSSQQLTFSPAICPMRGCSFKVSSSADCWNCSFRFDLGNLSTANHEIFYEVEDGMVDGRIDFDEVIYLKYGIGSNGVVKIVINTINALIYASFEGSECLLPSADCHQYSINQHNPITIHNNKHEGKVLLLSVVGLSKTRFTIRMISDATILQLKSDQSFAYLFDDSEQQLKLQYLLEDSSNTHPNGLYFNLISPPNSLFLTVKNSNGLTLNSAEGYLAFLPTQILTNQFEIILKKTAVFANKFVHLTLIVSTKKSFIRLDEGVTHYELIKPSEHRQFVFQYENIHQTGLNLLSESKSNLISMKIMISNVNQPSSNPENTLTYELSKAHHFFRLDNDFIDEHICQDRNCQLVMRIENQGGEVVEQRISVIRDESVIPLQQSTWETYEINELTRTNHFYYYPKHKDKTITILFKTDNPQLYLAYSFYSIKTSLNPLDWPFKHQSHSSKTEILTHTQEILIQPNSTEIEMCWPTCVLLMNINEVLNKKVKMDEVLDNEQDRSESGSYKLIVSNNVIEFPEDTEFKFVLKSQTEKDLLISLKYFMHIERLTFFTRFTLGKAIILAQLLSHGVEYSLGTSDDGLIFHGFETIIGVDEMKKKIQKYHLGDDVMLQICIKAQEDSILNIEFTSSIADISSLHLGDLEVITLMKGAQAWYEFVPTKDFTIKFYRIQGFPFIRLIKCSTQQYLHCLDAHRKIIKEQVKSQLAMESQVDQTMINSQRQPRIEFSQLKIDDESSEGDGNSENATNSEDLYVYIEKAIQVDEKYCKNCIFFIWAYCFEGELMMTLNLRSKDTQVEMMANQLMNEKIEPNQRSEYVITTMINAETNINIRILEGKATITVSDNFQTLFQEQVSENKYKTFLIPPLFKEAPTLAKDAVRHLVLAITASPDATLQAIISYSVGQSQLYLEDGLIIDQQFKESYPYTYYYQNTQRRSHAYFTFSYLIQPQAIKSLLSRNQSDSIQLEVEDLFSLQFYYYQSVNNQQSKEQFQPEKPPKMNLGLDVGMRSVVFELPIQYNLYEIKIVCKVQVKGMLTINHKEIIFLPFDYEFVVKLHSKEMINFVIETHGAGQIEFEIKKCDDSSPIVQYTNDVAQFKRGDFAFENEISTATFKQLVTTQPNSNTIHIKITADIDYQTIFTIQAYAATTDQFLAQTQIKAGKHGLVTYKFHNSNLVDISFGEVVCGGGSKCNLNVQYVYFIGKELQNIYFQSSCSANYFNGDSMESLKAVILQTNQMVYANGIYTFQLKVQQPIIYFGLKAIISVNNLQEIAYEPIQIATFWGQIMRIPSSIILMALAILSFFMASLLIISFKMARRGYQPISEQSE